MPDQKKVARMKCTDQRDKKNSCWNPLWRLDQRGICCILSHPTRRNTDQQDSCCSYLNRLLPRTDLRDKRSKVNLQLNTDQQDTLHKNSNPQMSLCQPGNENKLNRSRRNDQLGMKDSCWNLLLNPDQRGITLRLKMKVKVESKNYE